MMSRSNSLLTAWHSRTDKEPTEFELLNLDDMSNESIAWLRAAGEVTYLSVNKTGKLMALVYRDENNWRVDIRRSDNFQLREVVHHATPVLGAFFHNDILFSVSNKLVVSYPEDRHENQMIAQVRIYWVGHTTRKTLILF